MIDNSEHAKALSEKGAAKGGRARAESLSPAERKNIARQAAEARWESANIPKAICEGELVIAGKTIACSVLENGKRLLTQRTFLAALGRSSSLPGGTGMRSGNLGLPPFLAAENLRPFISDELRQLTTPLVFRNIRGSKALGYDATLLPLVCEVYLNARDSNNKDEKGKSFLTEDQLRIVQMCELLMRGFARVGIIALVDEATGYQEQREKDELSKILSAYVNPLLQPWLKDKFPVEFFREIYRLHGWEYKINTSKGKRQGHPRYIGKLINKWVYELMPHGCEELPNGILPTLQEKNPVTEAGYRKNKHYQFLTEDIGIVHLEELLKKLLLMMKLSNDVQQFEGYLAKIFPPMVREKSPLVVDEMKERYVQGELFYLDEDEEE